MAPGQIPVGLRSVRGGDPVRAGVSDDHPLSTAHQESLDPAEQFSSDAVGPYFVEKRQY